MANPIRTLGYSLRRLRKNPGLTLTVLLTLALGIGAVTAIFTVDYAVMLAPYPYPQGDQLVMVWSGQKGDRDGATVGEFLDWRQQNTSFQALNAYSQSAFNISTQDQPELVRGSRTTAGFYRVMGARFYMGRDFLPEEEQPGREHVVVLTYKLWKHLGADSEILGKALRLDNIPYNVVGVWAANTPEDRGEMELDVPLVFLPDQINYNFHWLTVMGRLKPGVTIAGARAEMNVIAATVAKNHPENIDTEALVEPVKNDWFPRNTKFMLWLLLGGVCFVLLIACANVANLLLAQGMTRQKELAVRIAIGATRKTIFFQQLIESLVLACTGGLMGIGVAYAILQALIAVTPPQTLPGDADVRLNLPILLFTFGATTLAGLLFGCAPAWYSSRVDPGEFLKEGGRSGTGQGHNRLRQILVIAEFALTLALLAGAGLAIHSFSNLQRIDLGIRTDHILTFGISVPEARPKDPEKIVTYYRQMLDSMRAVPGVSSAATMTAVPINDAWGRQFTIAGESNATDIQHAPYTAFRSVTPDYFQTFGVSLVKGRGFSEQDTRTSEKVMMVNQEFVRRFLKTKDPLQQRVLMKEIIPGVLREGSPVEWKIVGVFRDFHNVGLRREFPEVNVSFWQSQWPSAAIAVRTSEDPAAMIKSIAAAVHRIDPEIALANPRTMEQVRTEQIASDGFTALLFASFAGLALLLAAVGIYGVMAFSVAQRSHEIAIRMALGAGRDRVVRSVVREGLILACIGLGLGMIGAYFVGRTMQSLLFGVHAMDYSAFSAVGGVLLLTALLACLLPARRAASVEPMQALRTE
jgi:putative ABC transport system permease protein